jgi:hypothetical protein
MVVHEKPSVGCAPRRAVFLTTACSIKRRATSPRRETSQPNRASQRRRRTFLLMRPTLGPCRQTHQPSCRKSLPKPPFWAIRPRCVAILSHSHPVRKMAGSDRHHRLRLLADPIIKPTWLLTHRVRRKSTSPPTGRAKSQRDGRRPFECSKENDKCIRQMLGGVPVLDKHGREATCPRCIAGNIGSGPEDDLVSIPTPHLTSNYHPSAH